MLWIMHTPHAYSRVRFACLIISLCAFRIARTSVACKHFFAFLFTFSKMHNLTCVRLCIFKEKNPLFRRLPSRLPSLDLQTSPDSVQKYLKYRF